MLTTAQASLAAVSGRVTDGIIAEYDFSDLSGSLVADVSNVEPQLNLNIDDTANVEWRECGGLSISSPTIISHSSPATKIIERVKQTEEISLEAWIIPDNTTQSGPARIMTLSDGGYERNFTLGQNKNAFQVRLRTTTAGINGTNIYTESSSTINMSLTEPNHVVYTRASNGMAKLYINGWLSVSKTIDGTFAEWDGSMGFALANEFGTDRNWLGEYLHVAVYERALSSEEVQQNFNIDPMQDCNRKPSAKFSMNQAIGEVGLEVQFDASSSISYSGGLVSYSWDFGDGASGSGVSPSHIYTQVGDYFPLLTVTDSAGQTETQARYVKVMAPGTYRRALRHPDLLYTFSDAHGSVVHNLSLGVENLDLTIQNSMNTQWKQCGGLAINNETQINSSIPPSDFIDSVIESNALTLEAWVVPQNSTQAGPARIFTLSNGASATNFTLGQDGEEYISRLRTTSTNSNGSNIFTSSVGGQVESRLTHVVYTRVPDGEARIYVDGNLVGSEVIPSTTHAWSTNHLLGVANDIGGSRPWLGEIYMLAAYSQSLTDVEIAQNFNAGVIGSCNIEPVARFSSDVAVGIAPLEVNFDASLSQDYDGTILSYSWDFGDGSVGVGLDSSHSFIQDGVYDVTLTVTDDQGASHQHTQQVISLPASRITADQELLYTFQEGSGTIINDVSGVGTPSNLIVSESETSWLACGGISIDQETFISAETPPVKLANAVEASNELSLEVWIRPDNLTQSDTARIVTYSKDQFNRNLTLGQNGKNYHARLRTSGTNDNGIYPDLKTTNDPVALDLTQLVYTRNSQGEANLYMNGELVESTVISGSLNNWSSDYIFGLGDEVIGGRSWLGDYHLISMYSRALKIEEIKHNYSLGIGNSCANTAPVITSQPSLAGSEGMVYSYQVLASDSEQNALTYSLLAGPVNASIESSSGLMTWTPGYADAGTFPVTIAVYDGNLQTTQSFILVINNTNRAPVISSIPESETWIGDTYSYNMIAVDADDDLVTFSILLAPENTVVNASTGLLTWIPSQANEGSHEITVKATDDKGAFSTQTFTINVFQQPNGEPEEEVQNLPPSFTSQPVTSVKSNENYQYQAVATDPEGEILRYTLRNAPLLATISESSGQINWQADEKYAGSLLLTNTACYKDHPDIGGLKPVQKWAWTGSNNEPDYDKVMMMPVALPLLDSNNDGLTNGEDIPAIVFTTFKGATHHQGILRAIRGDDGSELWAVTDPAYSVHPIGSIAGADIDLDGRVEIVAVTDTGAIAFNHDGSVLWVSDSFTTGLETGVAITDLESDGSIEIIVGNAVLDATGKLLWQGTVQTRFKGAIPIAADINLDGYQEVIDGPSVYSHTGELLFNTTNEALAAVANMDDTPEAEVITVDAGQMRIFSHTGEQLLQVQIPRSGNGGPPTIADFDGDGQPEIGTVGYYNYVVYETDGTVLWTQSINDISSSRTGSSVFDFDGDGAAEVVYADEEYLRIFRGIDGALLYETPNTSGTILEYPIIVDIDGDGHAEIVAATNDFSVGSSTGIRAYEDVMDSWVGTRAIWNQYSYSINNINDDGTIPTTVTSSWQTHNTFRLNVFPDRHPLAAADLVVQKVHYDQSQQTLFATILNRGLSGASGQIHVSVQQKELNESTSDLAEVYIDSGLAAGASLSVPIANITAETLTQDVIVSVSVLDPSQECDAENNALTTALFKVDVHDPGNLTDSQTYLLNVEAQNHAPVIVSEAPSKGITGKRYAYQIKVQDQDLGDGHSYQLLAGPSGLIVQETSGLVTWVPALTDVGSYNVTLQATDLSGATVEQTYLLSVEEPNYPPAITSNPVSSVFAGSNYLYQVDASDHENDALAYELLSAPSGLTISGSGLVEWQTASDDLGRYTIVLQVSDSQGQSSQQSYILTVVNTGLFPQFSNNPYNRCVTRNNCTSSFRATDPNNAGLTFELLEGVTGASMSSDGTLRWVAPDTGTFTFRIAVEDGLGARNTRYYSYIVQGVGQVNQYPTISSSPLLDSFIGEQYSYQIEATDPNEDPLSYQLLEAPQGMSINNQGLLVWVPALDQVGIHEIAIWVDDGQAYSEQRFALVVQLPGNEGAEANLSLINQPKASAFVGQAYEYRAAAISDQDGDVSISLLSGPAGMTITANKPSYGYFELAWVPDSGNCQHNVLLELRDNQGNTQQISYTLDIYNAPKKRNRFQCSLDAEFCATR